MQGHLFFDAVKGSFRTRKLLKVVSKNTKIDTDTNEYLDYENK